MDRITANLLDTFTNEQALTAEPRERVFEKFVNYSVISHEYPDEFDVEDVTVAGDADTGIDGIAILTNGSLVNTEEEVEDLCELNRFLDIDFIFVQSKLSTHFDSKDISQFAFGVKDFFADEPRLSRNERIDSLAHLKDQIFERSALFTRGNPRCKLYYVTIGRWLDDPNLLARMDAEKRDLENMNIFDHVEFSAVDAAKLQQYFRETRNRPSATINFPDHIAMPDIQGVREAYIGTLSGPEYLNLILDENKNIRKSLFYDNMRDFQGQNPVNTKINNTILNGELDQFGIRNNGVTIVAKVLRRVGNRFNIEDYQIVNGCQTSHVLYNMKERIDERLRVPLKLIVTDDEAVTNSVIESTNSQTTVRAEELQALSAFQKKLEDYYNTFEEDRRLHYERRSRQYNNVVGIEKVRIVPIGYQIRYFAAI